MSDEFDLSGPVPSSPAQLALTVERLRGVVVRLNEKNDAIEALARELETKVEELEKFKADIKTGGRVTAYLATGTIALLGALAAFFSGLGTKLFTGGH